MLNMQNGYITCFMTKAILPVNLFGAFLRLSYTKVFAETAERPFRSIQNSSISSFSNMNSVVKKATLFFSPCMQSVALLQTTIRNSCINISGTPFITGSIDNSIIITHQPVKARKGFVNHPVRKSERSFRWIKLCCPGNLK